MTPTVGTTKTTKGDKSTSSYSIGKYKTIYHFTKFVGSKKLDSETRAALEAKIENQEDMENRQAKKLKKQLKEAQIDERFQQVFACQAEGQLRQLNFTHAMLGLQQQGLKQQEEALKQQEEALKQQQEALNKLVDALKEEQQTVESQVTTAKQRKQDSSNHVIAIQTKLNSLYQEEDPSE